MYELNIPLTDEEVLKYLERDDSIGALANEIRTHPTSYASRNVQIEEGTLTVQKRQSVRVGDVCPESGYWVSPARLGSRRFFKVGEVFHGFEGSDYGEVFWVWDGS